MRPNTACKSSRVDTDGFVAASQLAKLDADALYDVLRLDESEAVSDDDSEGGDADDI